ncbi:hypothetical protein OIU76_014407 [Salix suchowensis]|nr:hypothetical protein OIU76_014407 [Salix suchowensis]
MKLEIFQCQVLFEVAEIEGPEKIAICLRVSRGFVPDPRFSAHDYIASHHSLILYSNKSILLFFISLLLELSIMSKSSPSCLAKSHDHETPDLESIRGLVDSINEYMIGFLENVESWSSLKSLCTSMLNTIQNHNFFEFADHSVLSDLYWGIESIEAAIQAKCPEEKTDQLRNSERLLQVPALLDEHGVTAGIRNQFLVCFSYFYLSAIKKLQNDEWQVALHYLQAMLVSPRLVRTEFAPEFCRDFFHLGNKSEIEDETSWDFGEDNTDEAIRQTARRYKHWLMYCQIMLHGEISGNHCRSRNTSSPDKEPQDLSLVMKSSSDRSNSVKQGHCLHNYHEKLMQYERHPPDLQGNRIEGTANEPNSNDIQEFQYYSNALKHLDQVPKVNIQNANLDNCKSIRYLQEILMEGESDSPTSVCSCENYDLEEDNSEENMENSTTTTRTGLHDRQAECWDQMLQAPCSTVHSMSTTTILPHASQHRTREEASEVNIDDLFSGRFLSSISDLDLRVLELGGKRSYIQWNSHLKRSSQKLVEHRAARTKKDPHSRENLNKFCVHYRKDSSAELIGDIEKVISKLCFSQGLAKFEEDYAGEVMTIYEMLNSKKGVKYTMLKDVMLDQLLTAISTSTEERVIRASVSILTTIISTNKSAIEDIKRKGLRLCDLAAALKRNVHEAAILIHMINPSPTEMKTLELLPALVEVVCSSNNYKEKPVAPLLTPPAASLMIIEVLVTAFDCATNNTHLAAINSPRVLRELLNFAGNNNLEGYVSLSNVLVKCMQFDGQCRKILAQCIPVAPFICLLRSDEKCAKFSALQFFHELLRMPRSPAMKLLRKIRKEGGTKIMEVLVYCVRELPTDYQLLAANLLLQLDTLEDSSGKGSFKEEAIQIILKSVVSEVSSPTEQLSAFIFANLGGTYAWTGEPYTVAWLVKKAGLTSLCHRNMIRNYDWLDQNLKDAVIDSWSSKIGKHVIDVGKPVFYALEKGLRSKAKRVSRDSLTAAAWIGFEISKFPNSLRYSACEILLNGIEQFLHPGMELEERLLACLCIYNYASGRGMQKLVHFSEGVRESLRRFSGVTWMADELHRVADYYLPNQSRISCVHTQIVEANDSRSGAITSLIYYKGLLYSGHSDGSIKVWDIKQQSATIIWDLKEHKKAVTCFSLFEAGESLLSGSSDQTIRVWQTLQRKPECTEVIAMEEPIRQLETYDQIIFVITQGHRMKVYDSSRTARDICKAKKVKSMRVVDGKIYVGCKDSSILELTIATKREREIKAPTKRWMMKKKPINAVFAYRDWLYSASSVIEGSKVTEWRAHHKPRISIAADKGRNVLLLGVVEDFIYINSSPSSSTLQVQLASCILYCSEDFQLRC